MQKAKYCVLLFLSFYLFSLSISAQQALPQIIRRVKPAVVAIITYDSNGDKLAQGSGFFISGNRIVTNRHVIEDAQSAEIKLYDGKTFKINGVIASDEEADLVLLQVTLPTGYKILPLSISQTKLEEGERILVIGNPLGLEGTISDGLVSSIRESSTIGNVIQITAPISSGSSGSPVINLTGQVVGVATSQLAKGQNLNFAMPSVRISSMKPATLMSFADFSKTVKENNKITAYISYLGGKDIKEEAFKKNCDQVKQKCNPDAIKKDTLEALPFFISAVELDPNLAVAWKEIGDIYYDYEEKAKEAIFAYQRTVSLNPKDWTAWWNLHSVFSRIKEYDSSIKCLEAVILYAPASSITVDAATAIGDTYLFELKNSQSAISAYKRGLGIMKVPSKNVDELMGKLTLAIIDYGQELSIANKHYQAIEVFKEIISLDLPSKAGAYLSIGEEYEELKLYSDAESSYKKAISLKSDFAYAWNDLAYLYLFDLKNEELAIYAAKEAIRIKPDFDYAHYNLGLAYYFSGRKSLALEEYQILKPLNADLAQKLFNAIYK